MSTPPSTVVNTMLETIGFIPRVLWLGGFIVASLLLFFVVVVIFFLWL